MKKIMSLLLVLTLLLGCGQPAKKIEIQGIQEISYEELTQNLNSNVKFILYIGRPDCGDCIEFYPILQEYIETHDNTGIYYFNIKSFRDQAQSENATQQEKDFYKNLYEELHVSWTPMIHVISHGRFVKTYQYLDEDYIKIKDRDEQIQRREAFLKEFEEFMNAYFKEEE
jgi:hypothetical protein